MLWTISVFRTNLVCCFAISVMAHLNIMFIVLERIILLKTTTAAFLGSDGACRPGRTGPEESLTGREQFKPVDPIAIHNSPLVHPIIRTSSSVRRGRRADTTQ